MSAACEVCSATRAAACLVRRTPLRRDESAADGTVHAVCSACQGWLVELVRDARSGSPRAQERYGAPSHGYRQFVFEAQCHFCREIADRGVAVELVRSADGTAVCEALRLCVACDAWLLGAAFSGRRTTAGRTIDGPYGHWPFPNLRTLTIEVDVNDPATLGAIAESCQRMEVAIGASGGDVLFVEASANGRARRRLAADEASHRRGRVILVPLVAKEDLLASLPFATDWLTVPLTPQQVTAALTRALRQPGRPTFDPESGLRIADLAYVNRPALVLTPEPGVTPFEAAWFVKRACRGYDEVGRAGDDLLVLPRASQDDLQRVAARLARALAGRCVVRPYAAMAPPRHLDLVG